MAAKERKQTSSEIVGISEESSRVRSVALISPRLRPLLAVSGPTSEPRPGGRGSYGVNRTLEGAGKSKNYYVHFSTQHLSFQTDSRPRGYRWSRFFKPPQKICSISPRLCVELNLKSSCSAMAKGEGGEQYSNASLLNKPDSESVKLARKVRPFIHSFKIHL